MTGKSMQTDSRSEEGWQDEILTATPQLQEYMLDATLCNQVWKPRKED